MGCNSNKYYAVANGRETGVYNSWADCERQTSGHSGSVFKSFATQAEATNFVESNRGSTSYPSNIGSSSYSGGSRSYQAGSNYAPTYQSQPAYQAPAQSYQPTYAPSYDSYEPSYESSYRSSHIPAPKATTQHKQYKASDFDKNDRSGGKSVVIYTDGSSLGNGKASAKAGYGIFHYDGSPANVSGRLDGPRQTNQRAELTAIREAIRQVPKDMDVAIHTDSQYSISCLTEWNKGWEQRGWKNSLGNPVENQDIIKETLADISGRPGRVDLVKCPAHVGIHGNEMADKLANQGAMQN